MGFHDVTVPPPSRQFIDHIKKKIVVEVNASQPPHVLELWMVVSKGMLPVVYPCSNIDHLTVSRI